jgi:hypothetical protein
VSITIAGNEKMVAYKILKEKVWDEFKALCPHKIYMDLSSVGGTFTFRCAIENSMCRYPICPRHQELAANPNNFKVIIL